MNRVSVVIPFGVVLGDGTVVTSHSKIWCLAQIFSHQGWMKWDSDNPERPAVLQLPRARRTSSVTASHLVITT
jgi:hypothetical protein